MALEESIRLNLGLKRTRAWKAFVRTSLYRTLDDLSSIQQKRRETRWAIENLTIPEVAPRVLFPGLFDEEITLVDWRRAERNMAQDEMLLVCQLTRHLKPKLVLEIGTFDGRTTKNVATNLPDGGVVVTVDVDPRAGSRFLGGEYDSRIHRVIGDSRMVDFGELLTIKLGRPYFDLAIIDGLHALDAVESDTENCLTLLNPERGVVLWHDYEYYHYQYGRYTARCEVPLFLNRLARTHRLFHLKDSSFVAYVGGQPAIPASPQ